MNHEVEFIKKQPVFHKKENRLYYLNTESLFFYSQGRQRVRTTIFDTIQLHIKNQCGIS